jgi:hypothetical protein
MGPVLDFHVNQYGTFLATRSTAKTARESLEAAVEARPPDTLIVIRFDDIEAMTISFADEFLGRFFITLASGHLIAGGVRLSGLNEETREAVSICLERRELLAVVVDAAELTLVGKAETLHQTFQTAVGLGDFRAADLAAALSITPQNANNRLKRLADAGAVQRRQAPVSNRGGKEFVYTVVSRIH